MSIYTDAQEIIHSALEACLPDQAVRRALEGKELGSARVFLVALGKAAWQMAHAAVEVLGRPDGGLARGCQKHPPRRGKALQCAAHRFIRQHGVNAGSYNRFSLGTQGGIHGKDSFL